MLPSGVRWCIVALLLLTTTWKLVIRPENPAEVQGAILTFLGNQHFEATVTDRSMEYYPIIEATSESCHLWVARVSPLGHEADLVRRIGTAADRISYVFRGTVYGEQPVARTVASYLWFRFLRELGLVPRIPPVIAVVSSCDVKQLPWNELRS
jgi:hypothetical protein